MGTRKDLVDKSIEYVGFRVRGIVNAQRSIVALMVLVAGPAVARAQHPKAPPHVAAALTYTHPAGCKGEGALRSAVANVMGYDPFAPGAELEIHVTITRERSGLFVSRWGEGEWEHAPIVLPECGELVRQTGVSIALRVAPDRRREEPAVAREPTAPPALPLPAPPPAPPPPEHAGPPALAPPPKPGVFEGPAGIGRIVAFAISGVGIGIGSGLAAVSASKWSDVRGLEATLERTGGSGACSAGGAPSPSCAQLRPLAAQSDTFGNAAIGLMVTAGAVGLGALVSIPLLRTPSHSVEIAPNAPGALAAASVKGSW